jgi:hypothetical protein
MLPYSTIEPFGYTGIPTLMILHSNAPDSVRYIFAAVRESLKYAIDRWHVIQRARACGSKLSVEWPIDLLELRAKLAGGKNVKCDVAEIIDKNDKPSGFYMSITFNHPDHTTRFGSSIDYPDGVNSDL